MKKVIILIVVAAMSLGAFAQDVIVTRDAKKIDAKILEVSKTEIKYKEFNYQDGPTFVLGVEDLNSIIYANGKVVIYKQEAVDDSKNYQMGSLFGNTKKDEGAEQKVTVDFDIERTSNPMWFNFTNLSSGATEFRWDFGDGTWTFDKNARKVYENPGTYTVTLTATVGDRQYIQRKMIDIEGISQQEQIERSNQQLRESGAQLGQAIGSLFGYGSPGGNSWSLPGRDIKGTLPKPSNDFKQEGKVVVQIRVNAAGKVVRASVIGGNVSDKLTQQSAIDAAKKAKFTEGDSDVIGTITYIFKLN